MKTPSVRRLFVRGALFSASLLALVALGRPALAVNTSGYAYGWDSLNSFDYEPHSDSGIDSAISSGFTAFPDPTGHAQSWASAKLIGGVLTKTTGGYGWVDGTPGVSEYFAWSAFASGTKLIVGGAPTGDPVNLEFVLPGRNSDPDDLRPSTLPMRPPALANPQSQLLFNNTTFVGQNAPFFDVKVSLVARVVQNGVSRDLFTGDATLTSTGAIQINGDFNQVGLENDPVDTKGISFQNDFIVPIQVEAGVPFDLQMDLRMSMGDPDMLIDVATQPLDKEIFIGYKGLVFTQQPDQNLARGGGSFVIQLGVPRGNTEGLTLAEIPEPGTLGLALAGLIGLLGFARRRRRSR